MNHAKFEDILELSKLIFEIQSQKALFSYNVVRLLRKPEYEAWLANICKIWMFIRTVEKFILKQCTLIIQIMGIKLSIVSKLNFTIDNES